MAVLVPDGGFATVVVAEPPGWVVTANEVLVAVPEEQPYVIARVMPTSATFGSQESVAVGALGAEGQLQLVMHAPL